MSRKLQGFEQPYVTAKTATPRSTFTEPHYRDGNFKFCKKNFISKIFEQL